VDLQDYCLLLLDYKLLIKLNFLSLNLRIRLICKKAKRKKEKGKEKEKIIYLFIP